MIGSMGPEIFRDGWESLGLPPGEAWSPQVEGIRASLVCVGLSWLVRFVEWWMSAGGGANAGPSTA